MRFGAIFILFIGLIQSACATQVECSREEAIKAEIAMDSLKDWQSVYEAYKQYSHCDDGAIWEGFSSEISSLMANSWGQIDDLLRLTKEDASFEKFILKHLDEMMLFEDYEKIKRNVTDNCPEKANRICSIVDSRLKELQSK